MVTCVFVHLSASARVRLYALNTEVSVCVLERVCVRTYVRVRAYNLECVYFEHSCVRACMRR